MFKSWRSDKKKIKVVFQLQFQATQVPKLKKPGVTIALVPEDVGKPTLRLEKVAVQDGSCSWENPVYESVKMTRETKTGKLGEKIYHLVVSNGSSKAGFLGEALIDFADFAAETEPVTVTLPLKFANSGAILHVTIQKIEGAEDLIISREGSRQGMNYGDKVRNLTEDGDLDPAELFLPLRQNSMPRRAADTGMTKRNMHRRTNTDWSGSSTSDGSLVELANSPEYVPREWHKGSDPVEKLRSENAMLLRQVEVSELELQSLRKQILKENKRTQDLSRQITGLKEERDAAKTEFERLMLKKNMDEEVSASGSEDENVGSKVPLEEIRQELEHEKELNASFRLQLKKMDDSNSNLILAVRDLNEMLQQKNTEIARLSSEIEATTSIEMARSSEQHDANEVLTMKQTITDLNAELEFYKQNQQQESIRTRNESSEYLATINELESQVQRLEDKIKHQSEEYSESLIAINELESQVKELNKELENRTQGFEEELDAIIHAKTVQEQRAIRAEEALRTTRRKNAANAERLQEEFRKLSVEMTCRFDENEKMTMKAVAEANDLEIQKQNIEERLQEANEELRLLKDQTAGELEDLKHQVAKMSMELDYKTVQLEYAQKQEKEKQEAFSKQIQLLEAEIEKLEEQRTQFSDEAKQSDETKKVKTSNENTEMLIQRWNKERDELENKIAPAKKETEKAQKQLISTRSLKDKKEMVISNLQSEMENIRVECNDLKQSLLQEEREKEKLSKQLSQLRNDLQKKEDEISSIQNEFETAGGQENITSRGSHAASAPRETKDFTSLQKKLRLLKINLNEDASKTSANSAPEKENNLRNMIEELENIMEQLKTCHCSSADQCQKERGGKSGDKHHTKMSAAEGKPSSTTTVPVRSDANLAELVSEVEGLKERNQTMEHELKDMEERYSDISLKFAEVEGERQQLVMTVRNLKNGKKN